MHELILYMDDLNQKRKITDILFVSKTKKNTTDKYDYLIDFCVSNNINLYDKLCVNILSKGPNIYHYVKRR